MSTIAPRRFLWPFIITLGVLAASVLPVGSEIVPMTVTPPTGLGVGQSVVVETTVSGLTEDFTVCPVDQIVGDEVRCEQRWETNLLSESQWLGRFASTDNGLVDCALVECVAVAQGVDGELPISTATQEVEFVPTRAIGFEFSAYPTDPQSHDLAAAFLKAPPGSAAIAARCAALADGGRVVCGEARTVETDFDGHFSGTTSSTSSWVTGDGDDVDCLVDSCAVAVFVIHADIGIVDTISYQVPSGWYDDPSDR